MSGGFQWDDKSDKNYMSTVAPGAEMWSKPVTFSDRIGDFFHGLGMNRERATKLGGAFGFLPDAAYESGQTLAGKHGGAWAAGEAATYTPLGAAGKLGAFIGLPAMKRLHAAGLRPRNLPAGLPTERSYEDFKRIMPYDPDQKGLGGEVAQNWARENADNSGWHSRALWGSSPAKEHGLRTTEPVAWVPFTDARVRPDIKEYQGPLSGALEGDDVAALFAAEPRLADLPAEISTVYGKSPRGSIQRDPGTMMPNKIQLFGGNADEATRLGYHEMQHAFDVFDNPSLIPGTVDGIMTGTPAGTAARSFFEEARQVADMLGMPHDNALRMADQAIHGIDKHAFYLQSPWEQIARETARREAHVMSPRTLPGTYGGANPWAPDAMAPSWTPSWWNEAGIDHSMFQMPYKQR